MLADAPPPLLARSPPTAMTFNGHFERMAALAPYGLLANAAGVPAISVPRGLDRAGLPLAVQLIGRSAATFCCWAARTLLRARCAVAISVHAVGAGAMTAEADTAIKLEHITKRFGNLLARTTISR